MTDDSPNLDRTTTPACEIDEEDQPVEMRTDGGAVGAQLPDVSHGPIGTESANAPTPEGQPLGNSSAERSRSDAANVRDRSDRLVESGAPSEAVREQFSQAELNRLRTIASSGGRKSSWVIKRLLHRADDTNPSSKRSSLNRRR